MMTQKPASVLVVEDEALLLLVIAEDLRDAGYVVFEASNADQAIAQLELHPEISILFTDVDMPGSMDGLRLSAAVRDRWPPIKIIVTSGKRVPEDRALPGGSVFMPKPYTPSSVASTIRQLLD